MFVNRKGELDYLEKVYKKKNSNLIVIYGRRRIGKTELLRYFSKDKKHIFFSSDLSPENEQLRQFSEIIYKITKESFLQTQRFSSWEALLIYIFDHLLPKIKLIIIDEFPYLCNGNKALPSILQKIWDKKYKNSNVFLVLCGSYMSFMEKEVLGRKSPLFGRRTGQIYLQPLKFKDIKEFFPGYTKENRVYVYSILGGTPAYLEKFNDRRKITDNIKEEILNKNSFLYREPRFLLMEELREPSVYFSIIEAIAFGKTKINEIVQSTGITDRTKINKYLTVLRELHIVKREVPVTEVKPHKSRRGIYILEDPFFRFWFKYVFPNLSYLEEGEVDYVWAKKIKPDIDSFVGLIFEDICIQKIKELNRGNKLPFKLDKVGRWWNGKDEIDIVGFNGTKKFLFCECKWSNRKVGINILEKLEEKAGIFDNVREKYFGFFSKSGFTDKLLKLKKKRKDIMLFDY